MGHCRPYAHRARHGRFGYGYRQPPAAGGSDLPFRPRRAVHLRRFRSVLPEEWYQTFPGLDGYLLRQCRIGIDLRDLQERADPHRRVDDMSPTLNPMRHNHIPWSTKDNVVLLDLGVLVVDVQGRDDAVGDDPGAEAARGRVVALADDAPVEDQTNLVGAANVEVLVQHLLEEDSPGHRSVEHLR